MLSRKIDKFGAYRCFLAAAAGSSSELFNCIAGTHLARVYELPLPAFNGIVNSIFTFTPVYREFPIPPPARDIAGHALL